MGRRSRRLPCSERSPLRKGLRRLLGLLACLTVTVGLPTAAVSEADDAARRVEMVRFIELHARYAGEALKSKRFDPRVLEAMGHVPRHLFVPEDLRDAAYADRPLPIGYGQTISQPFMVALMAELVDPGPQDKVLEVGTGSGYHAAVLAELVDVVCSIEIIPELGETAARRLKDLDYTNIRTRIGDGYYGWPACGPFDGIVVTASASHVPPPLIKQLKPGGRMVIPVGSAFIVQHLMLVEKRPDGSVVTRQLLPVRFVPLLRAAP